MNGFAWYFLAGMKASMLDFTRGDLRHAFMNRIIKNYIPGVVMKKLMEQVPIHTLITKIFCSWLVGEQKEMFTDTTA